MAARAYWKGQIRLALVSIPVEIYPATKSGNAIAFRQIHEPSGKPVKYEKVVPGIGPIDREDIVKGYELSKGNFVLIDQEEIEAVKLESKHTLELVQFVDASDIDILYYEKPYYVVPADDLAEEAYIVLREALKKTKKIGLGQLVVRGKSSIVAVQNCGKGLLLEMLRYADEVQKADKFFSDLPKGEADKELMGLAEELIEKKAEKFNPAAFKDSFTVAVKELIDAKLEKRPPREIEEPQESAKVIDLMQALKRSVRGKDAPNVRKAAARRSRAKSAKRGASKRRAA
jgi:DNA end-binding protein Ku